MRWEDKTHGLHVRLCVGHDEPGLRRRPGRHVHRRLRPVHLDDPERQPASRTTTASRPSRSTGRPNAGVLGGGTLAAVNVVTTEAERDAAVTWIDFYYIQKLITEEGAVADAKALTANNQPVGVPALPIFDKATYDESQVWIKDYINVPIAQMTPFTSKIFDQPLVNEPVAHTQETVRGPRPRRAGRADRPERRHRRPARCGQRPDPGHPGRGLTPRPPVGPGSAGPTAAPSPVTPSR